MGSSVSIVEDLYAFKFQLPLDQILDLALDEHSGLDEGISFRGNDHVSAPVSST